MRRVVFNQKGGVGKSTITCNLAAVSAQQGLRTLVLDLDVQGNSTRYLLGEGAESVDGGTVADFFQQTLGFSFNPKQAGEFIYETPFERLHLMPSSPALDYALYLRGLVNFNDNLGLMGSLAGQELSERDQRASRDAWEAFKQLVDRFPDSRYTPDARLRMDYIVNSLAEYEVHVARYYFRRGAYVAAANRAQQAISQFSQTPSVEEALYILIASYDKLEMPGLRDAAERVLRQNFPESEYLTKGLLARKTPWYRF